MAADAAAFERCIAGGGWPCSAPTRSTGSRDPENARRGRAAVRAEGAGAGQAERGDVLRRGARGGRAARARRAHPRADGAPAAGRAHAAAAQPARALPARGRGRARPARAGRPRPARGARARPAELGQRRGRAHARRLADVPEPIRAAADLVLDAGELPGTPRPSSTCAGSRLPASGTSCAPARWTGCGRAGGRRDGVESRPVRRPTLLLSWSRLSAPSHPRRSISRPVVALAAGPGAVYSVVRDRQPERSVPPYARGSRPLGAFGSRGADTPAWRSGRRTGDRVRRGRRSTGFAYECGSRAAGRGDRPAGAHARRRAPVVAYPDDDGDVVLGRPPRPLTQTGPLLRHAPLDATDGPLILDLARSRPRTELRVLGPGARRPRRLRRRSALHRGDDRARRRPSLRRVPRGEPAHARLGARPTPRPLVAPPSPHPRPAHGAPAVARTGLRTVVATSQRVNGTLRDLPHHRRPRGHVPRSPHQPARSDLAPLAATGPDGRVYVACDTGEGPCAAHRQAPARGLRPADRANMTELQPDYFERPLAEVDPEVAEALDHELHRQRRTLEMIAVRELRAPGRPRVPGQRPHQQVRRGLPRQALLRRLRARRRHRAARDRPREGAVRRRPRQRAAARRRPGQHVRLPRAAAARRHDHGPRAAARRPPQPRHEDQRLRPPLRHRAVRGHARGLADRHGRGRADRPRAQAEAAARRLVGLPALPRLRALPRDRRRGRRAT